MLRFRNMHETVGYGARLKRQIEAADTTATEVAAKIGVSYATISKIIAGKRTPSKPVRQLLAQMFPALLPTSQQHARAS